MILTIFRLDTSPFLRLILLPKMTRNSSPFAKASGDQKIILHLDMDSYFASVEQQRCPELRGRPIGISGKPGTRTVVAAASREAKKFGVKSGMSTWEAQKLCPTIQFVEGNVKRYQKVTRTWVQILREFSPTLEIFSIDEAFIDITETHPLFGGPWTISRQIKQEIRQKLGAYITGSIGIARNKLLSKLVCKWVKPNGIYLLENRRIREILATTPAEEICGIGPKTSQKLAQLGIKTIQDIGDYPLENLRANFGIWGETLKLWGQGIDPSPVIPYWKRSLEKSISHSFTLPKHVYTFSAAQPVLFRLCERLARELRQKGFHGRTITLSLRRQDFANRTIQHKLHQPTSDARRIFEVCRTLQQATRGFENVRLVGVAVSDLISERDLPLRLFEDPWEKILMAMDQLNRRFGETVVHAGSLAADKILVPPVGYGRKAGKELL